MMAKLLPFPTSAKERSDLGEMSDAVLLAACANGDRAAMGELFDRHGTSVYRFLCRLGGSSTDVEDLLNATYLEAFRSVKRFRGGSQVRTWLFGIAVNVSRHHRRSEVRRRSFLTLWAKNPTEERSRPDQLVERKQLVTRVAHTLADLPHDLRAAYLLCDVEELSGTEAAAALGVPPGTLGRRLHEARKALRAALERGSA